MREVPTHISAPEYAKTGRPHPAYDAICVFRGEEIRQMRSSAKLAREMLDFACSLVKEGLSTEEIDRKTHEMIVSRGAYPSPINYAGFPKAICTSVNEVACHGIPDSRELINGDLLSIDVSIYQNGFHGDNCGTVVVGGVNETDEVGRLVVDKTEEALLKSIDVCGPGACLSDIGQCIHEVAEASDLHVIKEFCGHGLGSILHMKPLVKHYPNSDRLTLVPGMIFTVEPILTEGSSKIVIWDDGWTAATVDGGRAAQFEHEVLITENGYEILTII
jgi:methionyl aminopeptidase